MINFNKSNLIKIIGAAVVLVVIFFIFFKATESKGLNAFAESYANFRDQQYDTYIYSYVPVVDASSETGEENYFTYLAKAVDTKQTSSFRKSNAEQALSVYKYMNQKAMDTLSEHIGMLDSAASRLVESANKINNDEYRTTASEITRYTREIQQNYESLRLKYVERFNLQIKLLEELVDNGGDIFSLGITLKDGGTKIPKIGEEIKNLTEQTDKTSQKMDDAYFSLKGRADLKDYPNKFTQNQ